MPTPPLQDVFAAVAALPGVAASVEEAREAVDALLGHRVLRRYADQVAAESALRGARASAALEGADVPLNDLRRTVRAGGVLPVAERAVVTGALRVAAEVGVARETWRRSPLQVLARMHALAAVDLTDPELLGQPRADPARSGRLADLADLLTSPTDAPALVVAAVVHAELLAWDTFAPSSGVVARGAARLVVVTRGLDPRAVTAPEVGHLELGRAAYDDALEGYRSGRSVGLAEWVAHCARATGLGAREGVAVCEAVQRG